MKIFVDSGHFLKDSGVTSGDLKENVLGGLGMMSRDALRPLLEGYEVFYVPDDLDLRATLDWINERAVKNDYAIAIHFNSNNNPTVRGVEGYYAEHQNNAQIFSREIAKSLNIPDRGAKHDSETYVGSLGFLRKLNCDSVLVECGYLTNVSDRLVLSQLNAPQKVAEGIANAIKILFPLPTPPLKDEPPSWFRKFIVALSSWLANYKFGSRTYIPENDSLLNKSPGYK